MNRLSAYRTFGNAGYSPAKGKLRIFADRWYLVTFQNTESDQGGGYYLAEGEHTDLLPGSKAREARDAHLNHCNMVREWKGEVWSMANPWRGGWVQWFTSWRAAMEAAQVAEAEAAIDCQNAEEHFEHERRLSDAEIEAKFGQCSNWRGAADYRKRQAELEERNAAFWAQSATVERVR